MSFLKYYHSWNPKYLYNIYEGRKIKNYLTNEHNGCSFGEILKKMRIALLTPSMLYILIEQDQDQLFFDELLAWMQQVSGEKVFEYAHKVKDKNEPEENILWFNHQSYQQLQSWLVNEFEKSILKAYFRKSSYDESNLQKIVKLKRTHIVEKKQKNNLDWKKLLVMELQDLKSKEVQDLQLYQQRIKLIEDNYFESMANQIDQEPQSPKKQKKRKNRKRKGKQVKMLEEKQKSEVEKEELIKEDERMEDEDKSEGIEKEKFSTENKAQEKQKLDSFTFLQIEEDLRQKYSGQSHPELNSYQKGQNDYKKRSLSPDQQIMKKYYHEKSTKLTDVNNEDDEFEGKNKDEKNEQSPSIHCDKKKRKRRHKNNFMKEVSSKISVSLLNRQLNNFIDTLSIQTNNLYDHKVVCFERIRFFVQSIFPTTQAILFGSNAVGLSLPTSDIDIILFNLPCYSKEQGSEILAHLAIKINELGWIVSCSAYLNAKVPLIKLQIDPSIYYFETKRKCDSFGFLNHDPSLFSYLQLKQNGKKDKLDLDRIIKVDLTVNWTGENNIGSQSTQLMRNWMSEYPQMQRIIIAFKYILAQRNFNSNFKGGIGSYCLFIMVAAYIQEKGGNQQMQDSQFFMNILKFYGEEFENLTKSIVLRDKDCFISLEETLEWIKNENGFSHEGEAMNNLLRIFDPLNNRIMSGSCFQYNQIKAEFRRIHKEMYEGKENVEKEFELTYNYAEAMKIVESKKCLQKWLNRYEIRTGFSIKQIFEGGL